MLDIFNPLHNVKEICKEFLLLEDHLQAPEKRCNDCIRKHLLKAEAFAEEAIALDKSGKHLEICKPLPSQIRALQDAYVNGVEDHDLGQRVRKLRKRLSPLCFLVNTSRTMKVKKKKPLAKEITDGLWPSTQRHLPDYKYLVLAIRKSQNPNPRKAAFPFETPGVSARIRHSDKWIREQAVTELKKGQVGRMVSQTLHSDIHYTPTEWLKAVQSDLLGTRRINLKTPSSSVGEIISDERIRRRAVGKAIATGQKQILKRALQLHQAAQKNNDVEQLQRSAKMFLHLGKQTNDVYFFVKAAVLFEKIDDPREALAFQEVLRLEPDHPLKFWLGNKVEIAKNLKSLPKASINREEPEENLLLLGLLAFAGGVGLGYL